MHFGLKRHVKKRPVLIASQIILFVLAFPIFFTTLSYSYKVFEESIKVLFFSVLLTSLLSNGWASKIFPLTFVLLTVFKEEIFNVSFWHFNEDYKEKSRSASYQKSYLIEKYSITDYVVAPYYTYDTVEHFWHCKKLYFGGLLWKPIGKTVSYSNSNLCLINISILDVKPLNLVVDSCKVIIKESNLHLR